MTTANEEYRRGYNDGYRIAMTDVKDWTPGACPGGDCGHDVCTAVSMPLARSMATLAQQTGDCPCETCLQIRLLAQKLDDAGDVLPDAGQGTA